MSDRKNYEMARVHEEMEAIYCDKSSIQEDELVLPLDSRFRGNDGKFQLIQIVNRHSRESALLSGENS